MNKKIKSLQTYSEEIVPDSEGEFPGSAMMKSACYIM